MPQERRVNIVQGQYYVSGEPDVVVSTLLGSCVAACLHDPLARAGGVNHFLLPGRMEGARPGESERLGAHLMELLVNGLLKIGASRDRLQAKLFGGAKTVAGLTDIGAENGRFARRFLEREGIAIVAASLGGDIGRRIQYWPATGRARQQFMAKSLPSLDVAARLPLPPAASRGEVELF